MSYSSEWIYCPKAECGYCVGNFRRLLQPAQSKEESLRCRSAGCCFLCSASSPSSLYMPRTCCLFILGLPRQAVCVFMGHLIGFEYVMVWHVVATPREFLVAPCLGGTGNAFYWRLISSGFGVCLHSIEVTEGLRIGISWHKNRELRVLWKEKGQGDVPACCCWLMTSSCLVQQMKFSISSGKGVPASNAWRAWNVCARFVRNIIWR